MAERMVTVLPIVGFQPPRIQAAWDACHKASSGESRRRAPRKSR
jgi:hypothetical protein